MEASSLLANRRTIAVTRKSYKTAFIALVSSLWYVIAVMTSYGHGKTVIVWKADKAVIMTSQ